MSTPATSPHMPHQVVHASAGTGKTYYLTHRLLRLLLLGVRPGAIVAISFTTKAAAEIEARVFARAAALVGADDTALERLFSELQIEGGATRRQHARRLYEILAAAVPPLRVTTFHAFCLDLLRRLPQEAGLVPGFELSEDARLWRERAWAALEREAQLAGDAPDAGNDTRAALAALLADCDGWHNVESALNAFLDHRADWWAYTEETDAPVAFACARLRATLAAASDEPPAAPLAAPAFRQAAARVAALSAKHPTQTRQRMVAAIAAALNEPAAESFNAWWPIFFTEKGSPRADNDKLANILTAAEADEYLHCRGECLRVLEGVRRARRRAHTLRLSQAWYYAGSRLLAHFQALKAAANVLDFADLEWRAYRLLTAADHAEWVQYKLDRRIDHVLIDEFQDTNPTQWRLLLPLLSEMTAGASERARSILLVGDEKQAIYRFRRAEPALFAAASDWLETQGGAERLTQAASWRSAPAIIDFANLVFAAENAPALLPGFIPHTTKRQALWGRVEVLPLLAKAPATASDTATADALRNPLLAPRDIASDTRYAREAAQLVATIRGLIGRVAVGAEARPLRYGDILVLLRERTHAATYEDALRAAQMPYVGAALTRLNAQPEIQDLMQLLRCLCAPGDAFALASVLRSPLFGVSDADLLALKRDADASDPPDWDAALARAAHADAATELARAQRLLTQWRARVDTVPVHDLLDTIYYTGNVLARYAAATPAHLQARVRANLERLLALALEIDSGRYPTALGFLHRLEELELPAETPAQADAIRILTVHSAKGLEAPVVFLVDAGRAPQADVGLRPLIQWPADAPRPQHFHLIGRADEIDDVSAGMCATQAAARAQEENNLLYVALTRAQQMLFISGCAPHRGEFWHQALCARLRAAPSETPGFTRNANGDGFCLASGVVPAVADEVTTVAAAAPLTVDPALTQPLVASMPTMSPLAPSTVTGTDGLHGDERVGAAANDLARRRGRALHALLDAHSRSAPAGFDAAIFAQRFGLALAEIAPLAAQAQALIAQPALRAWFDPTQYDRAENEMPLLYRNQERDVYGVIDRVVCRGDDIAVIDYKTHAHADSAEVIARYTPQLRLYADGVRLLWPNARVRAFILFTADARAVEIDLRA